MNAVPAIALKAVNARQIAARTAKTGTRILRFDRTPPPIDITPEREYTDEQFYADLKKASKQLDKMVQEALEEDAQGKTRKFPV
jgi:hypothetical protein